MTDRDPVTGEPITERDLERLRAEAHEFLERYRAVPPERQRRHPADDRFSGPFGVDGEGEVQVEEPEEES